MTTTVRSVRVELEAKVAGYIRDIKLAGSVTDSAFGRAEERISATSRAVSRLEKNTANLSATTSRSVAGQSSLGREIERTGTSAGRAEKSIDKYSGRLRLAVDLGATLGTTLAPIGAVGVSALAGLASQGGFAAAALGATVLAAQGVGDALKAVENARLSGTVQDLQAAREAIHRLAPEAQDFVHHLEDLADVGRGLQFTAAGGILGGADDALTSLESRIPQVQRILQVVSDTAGRAIREGGESLASSKYDDFFDFLEHQARPQLDATADAVGNVAHGIAELFAATVPLQSDFASFLRSSTESFDDWATRLGDSNEFAQFVDYVRTNGPIVAQTAGSIADAIIQIAEAVAPLGGPTLQILGSFADLLATIADSPIGTPVFGALAAYSAFSRILPVIERGYAKAALTQGKFETGMAKGSALAGRARAGVSTLATDLSSVARYGSLATESTSRLKSQLGGLAKGTAVAGGLAIATSGVADSMGLSNTASLALLGTIGGPWGAAIGGGIGLALDFAASNNEVEDAVNRANLAIESGDYSKMATSLDEVAKKAQQYRDDWDDNNPLSVGFWRGAIDDLNGSGQDAIDTQARLEESMRATKSAAEILAPSIGVTAQELYDGAAATRQFSTDLSHFVGWLNKEEALRQYRDGLKALKKELKNGFTREDVDLLAAFGQNIAQVASQIKDPIKRNNFLDSARATLVDLAEHAGPKAEAAIDKTIRRLDQYNLTKAPPKKLEVDASGVPKKVNAVDYMLRDVTGKHWNADLTVDGSSAILTAHQVKSALDAVHDKSVTLSITTIRNSVGGGAVPPEFPKPKADGGTVPGARAPYGDKVLIHAAPGEEIISNRHGQADRFRADRAMGRIPAYADGGTVEDRIRSTHTSRDSSYNGTGFFTVISGLGDVTQAAGGSAKALKKLESAADKVEKSYDREKSKLDDLISQRNSTASSITSAALHDPFGNGLAGLDAQVEADTGDIDAMTAALATLVKNGLDPKSALYQQLAASMDVNTAQQLAALSAADLASRATRFQHRADDAAALGGTVAGQEFNEAVRDQTKATRELRETMKDLRAEIREMGERVKEGAHSGTKEGTKDVGDHVFSAVKDANDGRARATSADGRAGGRRR
jgi:hypothetical protein